jgi:glycosyltransferase involved in cell wall biosynthesis
MTRPGRHDDVRSVHVVIPAHDEAELIERCLASVVAAAHRLVEETGLPTAVVVVADRCTDATVDVVTGFAAGSPVEVAALPVVAGCVGRARDVGVRRALDAPGGGRERTWVATTDADSAVATDWLVAQVRAARGGLDLLVGGVRPDPASLGARVLEAWESRHRDPGRLHVHGANLGFRGSTYDASGGFPHVAEHEDVLLVRAAVAGGARWAVGPADVHTSARTAGRTPGGFAGYLRALAAEAG